MDTGYWDGHEEKGMGKIAKFMWNVIDDSSVEGKVVFNGLFGYLSLGLAKEGGKKNGMNGGKNNFIINEGLLLLTLS